MIATMHFQRDVRTWWRDHPIVLLRYAIQRFALFPLLRLFCRPLRIEGAEALEGIDGPVIIVANHRGHMDTPLVLSALPESMRRGVTVAAAKDYFFSRPLEGAAVSLLVNAFAFSRNGSCRESLEHCKSILRSGRSLLIYPEGARSTDGTLQRFKMGVGGLATETGVPVVPVHVSGSHEILPKGAFLPHPARVTVRIGEPVCYGRNVEPREAAEDLRTRVIELAGAIRLDRTIGNHYDAKDATPNVIFASERP